MASNKLTLHLIIHGSFQGMDFCDAMCREAQNRAVTGWVRNHGDGMEAVVHGEPHTVDALLQWIHQSDTASSEMRWVEIEPDNGRYISFEISGQQIPDRSVTFRSTLRANQHH